MGSSMSSSRNSPRYNVTNPNVNINNSQQMNFLQDNKPKQAQFLQITKKKTLEVNKKSPMKSNSDKFSPSVSSGNFDKEKNQHKSTSISTDNEEFDNFNDKLTIPYITSQKGSKKILKYFDSLVINNSQINLLFNKVIDDIEDLVNHKYGNYFTQKLISKLNTQQRGKIWNILNKKNILEYALNEFGNHSIQVLLNQAAQNEQEEEYIMTLFNPYLAILPYNKFGIFVILRMYTLFSNKWIDEIKKFIDENFNSLLFHINGVCLIKKYISYKSNTSTEDKVLFIKMLSKFNYFLLSDKYAHFLTLYIIEEWGVVICMDIILYVINDYKLALESKYGSMVLLKVIEKIDEVSLFIVTFILEQQKGFRLKTFYYR